MRFLGSLVVAAILASQPFSPARAGIGPRPQVDRNFPPLYGQPQPDQSQRYVPGRPMYRVPPRPAVYCDAYGRCWQQVPSYRRDRPYDGDGRGYDRRYDRRRYDDDQGRPPGWAAELPYGAWGSDRFVRLRADTVCDRLTGTCYRDD